MTGPELPSVLMVYTNPDSTDEQSRYLPLRWGTLEKIHVTDQIVQFKIRLEELITISESNLNKNETFLKGFSQNMREYFGNRTLLERPTMKWVLLGEQFYLMKRDAPPGITMENAWDSLLSIIQKGGFYELKEKDVFLQVSNLSKSTIPKNGIGLKEGEKTEFQIRYYIPDFDYYAKNPDLNDSRSLTISTSNETISIQGYECKPLSKYDEIHFSVICGAVSQSQKVTVVVESKIGSPYFPRVEIPFELKKANASDG